VQAPYSPAPQPSGSRLAERRDARAARLVDIVVRQPAMPRRPSAQARGKAPVVLLEERQVSVSASNI